MPALNLESYTWILADHMEFEHEREMPGHWTFKELDKAHKVMHKMRGDWGHEH